MLAAGFYLGYAVFIGWKEISAALILLGWSGILLVLSCSLSNYLIRFFRWNHYLRCFGHVIPLRQHLLYYIGGFALTTTPGKAGETVRSLYLKRHQVSYTHSLAAFFTERFLDVLTLVLIAQLALLTLPGFGFIAVIVTLMAIGIVAFNFSTGLMNRADSMLARWPDNRFRMGLHQLLGLFRQAHTLFSPSRFTVGLLLGILAWLIQGFAFYFITHSLGADLPVLTVLAIYALGILAGAVSFIPGGIGSTEAALALLLYNAGAPQNVVLTAPFLIRIGTLWFAVTLGIVATSVLAWQGKGVTLPKSADHG